MGRSTGTIMLNEGRRRGACLLVVLASAAVFGACDESLSSIAGPTPNLQPTFASIQREIFDSAGPTNCTSCHNQRSAFVNGSLDLQADASYTALVNVASRNKRGAIRVIPGDPENSYLIHKIEGRPGIFGFRMPDDGPPFLSDGQIVIIKRWIQLGARND